MAAYYNEIDPYCAAWLRNLIAAGLIAAGDVDERDIRDVEPADLRGYTQCHFFAGIGVWSHALRLAGWPDDRPVWTGSCPCQPFSAAGRGAGFADERHLWPHWFHLISQCRPRVVFGEQVASKDGLAWFDLVSSDLAGADYTGWVADLCAAGVGAPHIRQRLFYVADADGGHAGAEGLQRGGQHGLVATYGGAGDGLADADERSAGADGEGVQARQPERGRGGLLGALAHHHHTDGLGAPAEPGVHDQEHHTQPRGLVGDADAAGPQGRGGGWHGAGERAARPAGVAGEPFWSDADWIACRDGKARPAEPGTFPLAHGAPARVGRLRAYGNAIVAPLAAEFVASYLGRDAGITPQLERAAAEANLSDFRSTAPDTLDFLL